MRTATTPGQTKVCYHPLTTPSDHNLCVQLEGSSVFKSYDKNSGVSLRSSKVALTRGYVPHYNSPPTHTHSQLKTPMSLGQKKSKAIEQLLEELGVPTRPIPTEQICVQFNDLRCVCVWGGGDPHVIREYV